jgi:hypothetical protein
MAPKRQRKQDEPIGFLSTRIKKANNKNNAFKIFVVNPVSQILTFLSAFFISVNNYIAKNPIKKQIIKKKTNRAQSTATPKPISDQVNKLNPLEKQIVKKDSRQRKQTAATTTTKGSAINQEKQSNQTNINSVESISFTRQIEQE